MPSAIRPLISERKIRSAVRKLAREVDRFASSEKIAEMTVVCVMDGAFIFCADLVRKMKTPTRMVFVKARSYKGTKKGVTALSALPDIPGQPVLIVDTIYDTGETIAKVIRAVRKHTSRIALALLVEKHREAPVAADANGVKTFVGMRLKGDPFLIGYGLDCSGKYRYLRDIRILKHAGHLFLVL